MGVARVVRSSLSEERDGVPLAANNVRKQDVMDRMVAGSNPSVAYWSERNLVAEVPNSLMDA